MTRSFFTIDEETNEDKTVMSSKISQSIAGVPDIELGQSGYFGGANNQNQGSFVLSKIDPSEQMMELFEKGMQSPKFNHINTPSSPQNNPNEIINNKNIKLATRSLSKK